VVGLCYCLYLFIAERKYKNVHSVTIKNPFELGPALKFGLLFIVIMFISKVAHLYLGNTGIYLSSFVAGLADVDAIALSMARLSKGIESIDLTIATQAIILATIANTVLKGGFVLIGADPSLKKAILPGFILMLGVGVVVLFTIA
jgi:uncharacterized membrane protein (DUF4010 family)